MQERESIEDADRGLVLRILTFAGARHRLLFDGDPTCDAAQPHQPPSFDVDLIVVEVVNVKRVVKHKCSLVPLAEFDQCGSEVAHGGAKGKRSRLGDNPVRHRRRSASDGCSDSGEQHLCGRPYVAIAGSVCSTPPFSSTASSARLIALCSSR
ncbi:MAG: hypothetical protein ACRDXC_03885 [Acidimicrobiales bacterium]